MQASYPVWRGQLPPAQMCVSRPRQRLRSSVRYSRARTPHHYQLRGTGIANMQVDQAVEKLEAQGRRVTHFSVVSS